MRRVIQFQCVIAALLAVTQAALAADTAAVEKMVKSAVNGTTAVVVSVDSAKLEISPKLLDLARQDSTGALNALMQKATEPLGQVRELLQGETGCMAIDLPYSMRVQARLSASTNVPEDKLKTLAEVVWPMAIGQAQRAAGWRTISLGATDDAMSPIGSDLIPAQSQVWESALQETADFPIQVAVAFPKYLRDTFAEIDPELPEMWDGVEAKTLVSGVEWISFGIEPQKMTMRIVVQAESNETAEAVKSQIPQLFSGLLKEAAPLDQTSRAMAMAILGLLQPTVRDSQIVLSLEDPQQSDALLQLGTAAIAATTKPMAAAQTTNNLKQLALAFHNYESAFQSFPTYPQRKKSKGLSWRVHILLFMEQVELYNAFHLDEAWDSPHNIKLLERMPDVYKPVISLGSNETVKPFHTTYVAPIGEKTVFGQDESVRFRDITDGSSNTILYVEVKPEHAIPWTSPEEYRFDPKNPAEKLRSVNGFSAIAMLDGSVQRILDDQSVETWNALFSRNGGEVTTIKR